MASVTEIATELHRLVKGGLVKPSSADPTVYVAALSGFPIDVLEAAVSKFLQGQYREHSTTFYPSAPQLAGYCRQVQQERHEAGYADRFRQRVREANAAQAAREKLFAERQTPEAKARIAALMERVPKGDKHVRAELDRKIRSAYARHYYGMTEEALAQVPDAGASNA